MSINKEFRVKHGLISDGNVAVQGSVTATSFSGNGNALTNIDYANLINKPTLVKSAVQWTTNHTLVDGTRYLAGDVVYDNGNIYRANYDNESIPTSSSLYWTNLGPGNRLNIDGRDIPNISYTQLSNIPSDLASQTYVQTQIANLVASAPSTLDTLKEIADQLAADESVASALASQVALKANTSSLATVAFSGSYNDLLNKPNLSTLSSVSTLQFDTTYNGATPTGQLSWNSGDGTLDLGLAGGTVVLQVGQEQVQRIWNNTGATLTQGQAVYTVGSQGQRLTVGLASAAAESTSSKTFGVVTENIANETEGYITTEGLVRNINTSAFPQGAALWLSPTTPGALTTTKPTAPQHLVLVGFCVRQHASSGVIFVKVQNGYELDELHDVLINGKTNNDVLKYDSATGVWKNAQLAAVAYSNSYTDLTNKPTNVSSFTNDANYATQTYVNTQVSNVINAAPAALDTLNELAAALGNDANFASTVTNSLATKANLSGATFTGAVTATTGTFTSLRNTGTTNLGSNTYNKAAFGNGDIALDNGTTDSPGLLFYYANNKNWGIDTYNNGSTQVLRFVSDLNESGGAIRAYLDNTGKITATSFAGNGSALTGVIQVVQAVKTDAFSGTAPNNTTFTAITGLSATITPKSTSSKILIMTSINYDSTRGNSGGGFAIFRNGSILGGAIGDSNGIQYRVFADFGANANADQSGMSRSFQVVDSPSTTSALTYDIRFTQDSNSFTTYINRARADAQNTDDGRFASSIILMEIA